MSSLPNSGGTQSAPNRAPAQKVIAGALANNRVANALISALGVRSVRAILATSTSQTANFGSLQAGDLVVHLSLGSSSPLGAAAGFAILGASAITNTGSSVVTGNLGLYPGTSVTGFPPGVVSGMEYVADMVAQAAQAAASSAYTTLNAESATAISSTLDGQTLTPGVYKESSGTFNLAASGPGTLTLNGAGTYIFQCSSTLVTGAGGTPTITLSGGATAANVYWLVGSSATINSGNAGTFQGNIIAQASITDTEGGTVNGSMIALTGAVTLSAAANVNTESSPGSGGQASFSTIATAGNLGYAAVVGDLYLDLSLVNLNSNNPLVPPPPAQLTGRLTGNDGTEF
jgi:hypothetical protein